MTRVLTIYQKYYLISYSSSLIYVILFKRVRMNMSCHVCHHFCTFILFDLSLYIVFAQFTIKYPLKC